MSAPYAARRLGPIPLTASNCFSVVCRAATMSFSTTLLNTFIAGIALIYAWSVRYCLNAPSSSLPPSLPPSFPACLPQAACLPACQPASQPACLLACQPACQPPCLPASQPACLPPNLPACQPNILCTPSNILHTPSTSNILHTCQNILLASSVACQDVTRSCGGLNSTIHHPLAQG